MYLQLVPAVHILRLVAAVPLVIRSQAPAPAQVVTQWSPSWGRETLHFCGRKIRKFAGQDFRIDFCEQVRKSSVVVWYQIGWQHQITICAVLSSKKSLWVQLKAIIVDPSLWEVCIDSFFAASARAWSPSSYPAYSLGQSTLVLSNSSSSICLSAFVLQHPSSSIPPPASLLQHPSFTISPP